MKNEKKKERAMEREKRNQCDVVTVDGETIEFVELEENHKENHLINEENPQSFNLHEIGRSDQSEIGSENIKRDELEEEEEEEDEDEESEETSNDVPLQNVFGGISFELSLSLSKSLKLGHFLNFIQFLISFFSLSLDLKWIFFLIFMFSFNS